jgi:HSP20 family protein
MKGAKPMFDLIPWEGKNALARMRKEMDDLWNRFIGGSGWPTFSEAAWGPAVDVKETKDSIVVTAEIPGQDAKDIAISIAGDLLTIRGEKKQEKEEKEETYHLIERRYGSFSRTIRLSSEVDTEKIKATHKEGVLTITLPKTQKAKEKTVKIEVE